MSKVGVSRALVGNMHMIGDKIPSEPIRRRKTVARAWEWRKKVLAGLLAVTAVAILAVAIAPIGTTRATPTREGGNCDTGDGGCHDGAQTSSMMTITGLPSVTYVPGQPYTITITITDTNGAGTGQNNFDIIASAGTFSSPNANMEINSATEASANDGVDHTTLTSGTVTWTAPASGSVTMNGWAVMGDGLTGTHDIWDHESYTYTATAIPEFSVLLLPVIGVIGIVALVSRATKK